MAINLANRHKYTTFGVIIYMYANKWLHILIIVKTNSPFIELPKSYATVPDIGAVAFFHSTETANTLHIKLFIHKLSQGRAGTLRYPRDLFFYTKNNLARCRSPTTFHSTSKTQNEWRIEIENLSEKSFNKIIKCKITLYI